MSLKVKNIDIQFYHLFTQVLPKKVKFPDITALLVPKPSQIPENSPFKGFTEEDFKDFASMIFLKPFDTLMRGLYYLQELDLDLSKNRELIYPVIQYPLLEKAYAAYVMFTHFVVYCGIAFVGALYPKFIEEDLRASLRQDYGYKSHRDHFLHSFNMFCTGLWLYFNVPFISESFEKMLKKYKCRAYFPHPFDQIDFQFFEQWFITSMLHDIGYAIEIAYTNYQNNPNRLNDYQQEVNHLLESINEDIKSYSQEIQNLSNVPISIDPIQIDLASSKVDIGKILEIDYGSRAWDMGEVDEWKETGKLLQDLERNKEQLEPPTVFNHGLVGAKILYKLFSVITKYHELISNQDIWPRRDKRNKLLPCRAIASHTKRKDQLFQGGIYIHNEAKDAWEQNSIEVSKQYFEDDFLSTLLRVCDDLVDFDRVGKKQWITPACFNRLEVEEKNDTIFIARKPLNFNECLDMINQYMRHFYSE
jgi:hypothetical protein